MPTQEQQVFAALADKTRRDLLRLLAREELPVHALAARFEISRPAISRHLKLLQNAGLVECHPQGRENVYRFNPLPLKLVQDWSELLSGYWAERLGALQELAREEQP
ncbi:MAG: metalloregulator ArsR/SmtB family transcription factor [Xanthomonadales bacterium]|nr:metalloregulator ArsR/SmtB family transcription factor [Xanthomonadales bacterium]